MNKDTAPNNERLLELEYIEEAKRLLHEKLANHSDAGVRTVNEIVELADDNPSVLAVAAALRSIAAMEKSR